MADGRADGRIDYWDHITVDRDVRFGKTCIALTRITVSDILEKMAHGVTEDDILSEGDHLTPIQIGSCLANGPLAQGKVVPNRLRENGH